MYNKISKDKNVNASMGKNLRPRVDVEINGKPVNMLYDTGASRSIVTTRTMKRLFGEDWKKQRYRKSAFHLTGAGGEQLKVTGIFTIDLQVLGHKMKHDFYVIANCNDDIIGIDFINAHCLGYDPRTQ